MCHRTLRYELLLFLLFPLISTCSEPDAPAAESEPVQEAAVAKPEQEQADAGAATSLEELQARLGLEGLARPWTGDLDGMLERRVVRVLTVYGIGRYFLDGPRERGVTYEMFKQFEAFLNERAGSGHVSVHVLFFPVARDELLPALIAGRGDIVSAGLTITPERRQLVDFSDPYTKPLREIVVTGPSAPPIRTLEDLSGQTVVVRLSSSYHDSLNALSRRFEAEGRAPITIEPVSEWLEDEDLLEMVNGGLLPWAVVDDFKSESWSQVFEELVPRPDLVLREGGQLGYAIRPGSPQLQAALNEFLKTHREGTLFGNMMRNRYVADFDWVANALAPEDLQRFRAVRDIFLKYGDQYGFDYLLVAAQGYQESRLDQNLRSHVGAVGIMQLLPSTAADPNVGIPDISEAESNIHAGVRYLDFIRKRYFNDPALDRLNATLLALASYNAGPARVRDLRAKAAAQGLDPNKWFNNVEIIAAREIGRETVQYVANIYKYYVTYSMSTTQVLARASEREEAGMAEPR